MVKLFVDDIRIPRQVYEEGEWTVARNYKEALQFLTNNWDEIETISLDHDLGELFYSGYDIANEIERICYLEECTHIPELLCHSMNPVGRAKIKRVFESIKRRQETKFS